jgi:isoamylase
MQRSHWDDPVAHCFGMLIDGRARPSGIRQRGTEATLLIVMNAYHDFVEFTLPAPAGGSRWKLVLDTNVTEQIEGFEGSAADLYGVTARSLVMFTLLPP